MEQSRAASPPWTIGGDPNPGSGIPNDLKGSSIHDGTPGEEYDGFLSELEGQCDWGRGRGVGTEHPPGKGGKHSSHFSSQKGIDTLHSAWTGHPNKVALDFLPQKTNKPLFIITPSHDDGVMDEGDWSTAYCNLRLSSFWPKGYGKERRASDLELAKSTAESTWMKGVYSAPKVNLTWAGRRWRFPENRAEWESMKAEEMSLLTQPPKFDAGFLCGTSELSGMLEGKQSSHRDREVWTYKAMRKVPVSNEGVPRGEWSRDR